MKEMPNGRLLRCSYAKCVHIAVAHCSVRCSGLVIGASANQEASRVKSAVMTRRARGVRQLLVSNGQLLVSNGPSHAKCVSRACRDLTSDLIAAGSISSAKALPVSNVELMESSQSVASSGNTRTSEQGLRTTAAREFSMLLLSVQPRRDGSRTASPSVQTKTCLCVSITIHARELFKMRLIHVGMCPCSCASHCKERECLRCVDACACFVCAVFVHEDESPSAVMQV